MWMVLGVSSGSGVGLDIGDGGREREPLWQEMNNCRLVVEPKEQMDTEESAGECRTVVIGEVVQPV